MFSFFHKKITVNFDWLGVDIHSHLLPGLDDGAPNVDISLELLLGLNGLGFNKFICTPHIFADLYPNTRESILPALEAIKNQSFVKDSGICIDAAAEYMCDSEFQAALDSKAELMNLPGNFVLMEMSYVTETIGIENYIFKVKLNNYTPILAHPERYLYYHGNVARIKRLKDLGCFLQLNLLSLTGIYGEKVKRLASELLKRNLYDFAATDCHHVGHLNAFQNSRIWKSVYEDLRKYPFRNAEIFG